MTTSSMSSPSLTLVKIMLLLKIVSLSFMHTVQPAQQVSDSRLRQLSDSCPTVSDSDSSVRTLAHRPTVRQSDSTSDSPTVPTVPRQQCSNASLASIGLFVCNSTVCVHPWNQDGQCSVHAEVDVNLTVATMIAR